MGLIPVPPARRSPQTSLLVNYFPSSGRIHKILSAFALPPPDSLPILVRGSNGTFVDAAIATRSASPFGVRCSLWLRQVAQEGGLSKKVA
jgi:hypothetical protein